MAKTMQQAYSDDMDDNFDDDIGHCLMYAHEQLNVDKPRPNNALCDREETRAAIAFPNMRVALIIYLTIVRSNAEGKR